MNGAAQADPSHNRLFCCNVGFAEWDVANLSHFAGF